MAKRLNPRNLPHIIKSDHELFTFFRVCFQDGCSQYEKIFNEIWGKKISDGSHAPAIANFSSADDSDEDAGDLASKSDSQSSSESSDDDDTDDVDDEEVQTTSRRKKSSFFF